MSLTVVQDTREKKPWDFSFYGYDSVIKKLNVGDYSILGMEDSFFIERKASVNEFSGNIGVGLETFNKELERSLTYKHKFILFEFSPDDIINLPSNIMFKGVKKKRRITPNYIFSFIDSIYKKYEIEILYANGPGNDLALEVIEYVFKKSKK